jgi:hypothetical protein
MRLNNIEKLYKKLSPTHAATLVFEAAIRRDNGEMEAIADSQPQVYFVGASHAYRSRVMGLINLALFYGTTYWQARALAIQTSYTMDESATTKALTKIGSVEQALIETCSVLGVDIAAVKSLSFSNTEQSFVEYAEATLTAQYIDVFTCLVH